MGKIFDEYGVFGCICVIILAIAIVFGALCLDAWLLMMLWNAVLPYIWATAPMLKFWPAFGLLLLSNILFKTPRLGKSNNDD